MVNKTRHLGLTINRFKARRNVIVAVLLAAWLLSAILVSLWFALQNKQYRTAFDLYTKDIQQVLTVSNADFKKLHDNSDTAGTASALAVLADTLGDKAGHTLVAPTLFGVRFGTESEARKEQLIVERIRTYADSLRQAAIYVDYQQKVAAPLGELALKSATNAQQITQLGDAWRQAADAHKQIQPPGNVAQQHAALGQRMDEIQAQIAQMKELYAKTDVPGFTAKQKELQGSIAALKPIGEQFAAITKQYDIALRTSLDELQSIIN